MSKDQDSNIAQLLKFLIDKEAREKEEKLEREAREKQEKLEKEAREKEEKRIEKEETEKRFLQLISMIQDNRSVKVRPDLYKRIEQFVYDPDQGLTFTDWIGRFEEAV